MSEAIADDAVTQTPLQKVWGEIEAHGLERYVAEMDANGYTVIPPELASPNGLCERLLEAVMDVAEKRNGVRPDLETGSTHENFKGRFQALAGGDGDSPIGDLMQSLLFEGEVFEEALMNPVLLTMASYLCGYSVVLSSMGCFMKGPNVSSFFLHSDTPLPSPLPPHALVCNLTYVLTEFNKANGSTAFVPGSHKWCRSPEGDEAKVGEGGNPKAIAVAAAPGSLLCWHGNTWHGAFNRTAPGLRVSVPVYMSRPYIRTQEGLVGEIPDEMLDRNPARFAILTQQGVAYGYKSQDDSMARGLRAFKYAKAYADEDGGPAFGAQSLYS
ncbi:MAG: phytanoyl-CoA dioxygenase family protein [Gammaproteobacteria bacterium]|nr:phytanoyl-CoA dioxygenase family protein [Gammaproteobacteria bacterium]